MDLAVSSASASGMSWKIFRILSLVMWSSITSVIRMPNMLRIALCQNAFSLSMCDCRSAQVSHPHRSKLAGMARKISFLAFRSAYGFLQKWRRAPMAWLAFVILFLMSLSSVRSKEMNDPRYLKCAVKSIKDSSSMWILFVVGESQYSCSLCCWDIV